MVLRSKAVPEPVDGPALVAPVPGITRPWEGTCRRKPWQYRVTATLAHLNTPELLEPCIELLRLQTVRPFVVLVDTGSEWKTLEYLESLRAEDLEVHFIRGNAYRHSSEPVGVACGLAFERCQTAFLFMLHADVFLKRRDCIEHLLSLCCSDCPAVGWEMSPRDWITDDWQGMISHTCSLFHMPTMWRAGVSWSFTRAHEEFGIPWTQDGWPDTETCPNLCLRKAGIKPLLLGPEQNYVRQQTQWWDHVRSYTGARMYSKGFRWPQAQAEMKEALQEARERAREWKKQENPPRA